jgi:hypothetical protein
VERSREMSTLYSLPTLCARLDVFMFYLASTYHVIAQDFNSVGERVRSTFHLLRAEEEKHVMELCVFVCAHV